jgi:hypothetical protein
MLNELAEKKEKQRDEFEINNQLKIQEMFRSGVMIQLQELD